MRAGSALKGRCVGGAGGVVGACGSFWIHPGNLQVRSAILGWVPEMNRAVRRLRLRLRPRLRLRLRLNSR